MRCIVTAGPTFEPLDDVRRLTNFSTGRLGSELAAHLSARGHEVILLLGEQATYCGERRASQVDIFSTTEDLRAKLGALSSSGVEAVLHAAAVSDFRFGNVWHRSPEGELAEVKSGKISTRQGTLMAELVPTAKIIAQMRDWFPQACLIGWKYEVEGDKNSALRLAQQQMAECRTDACVVNGPAYGPGFGFARPGASTAHCAYNSALFCALESFISRSASVA